MEKISNNEHSAEDADDSLKAFSGALEVANGYYQNLAKKLRFNLSSSGPVTDVAAEPERP